METRTGGVALHATSLHRYTATRRALAAGSELAAARRWWRLLEVVAVSSAEGAAPARAPHSPFGSCNHSHGFAWTTCCAVAGNATGRISGRARIRLLHLGGSSLWEEKRRGVKEPHVKACFASRCLLRCGAARGASSAPQAALDASNARAMETSVSESGE